MCRITLDARFRVELFYRAFEFDIDEQDMASRPAPGQAWRNGSPLACEPNGARGKAAVTPPLRTFP